MRYDLDTPGSYYLDTIRDSDEEALVEHLQEPEISRNTLTIPWPYTAEDARAFIARQKDENRAHERPVTFVIRDADDRLVGAIGLKPETAGPGGHRAEAGYWVARPLWGKGVATTALCRLTRYAFEELGLRRIVAHVYVGNRGSIRVLEKCGFRREGMLRQHFLKGGKPRDVIVYGLLPEDRVDSSTAIRETLRRPGRRARGERGSSG